MAMTRAVRKASSSACIAASFHSETTGSKYEMPARLQASLIGSRHLDRLGSVGEPEVPIKNTSAISPPRSFMTSNKFPGAVTAQLVVNIWLPRYSFNDSMNGKGKLTQT